MIVLVLGLLVCTAIVLCARPTAPPPRLDPREAIARETSNAEWRISEIQRQAMEDLLDISRRQRR